MVTMAMELTKRNSSALQRSMKSLESGHRCCINKEHNASVAGSSFVIFVSRTYNPSSATSYAGFTCKLFSLPANPTEGIDFWDGIPAYLPALCAYVEGFSGWTDTWFSMKVNIQHFVKHKLLKWLWNCSVKRNPLVKNNGHWSTALPPGKFCIRITTTTPRKMRHLKLCPLADSHWWLKLASAEQCWQRN